MHYSWKPRWPLICCSGRAGIRTPSWRWWQSSLFTRSSSTVLRIDLGSSLLTTKLGQIIKIDLLRKMHSFYYLSIEIFVCFLHFFTSSLPDKVPPLPHGFRHGTGPVIRGFLDVFPFLSHTPSLMFFIVL